MPMYEALRVADPAVFQALELVKYDPRYLNEEGFIYSLFSS